ncbi:hypothetical protein C8J57DRAFT_1437455 [Mycena rebaudengoi]|nr:hypothetical protein C8J57DRAFT_1437455 [Mycena rebaudengoi]
MPCAPFTPTVAIATRVLEMFRIAHLRTPTITIQSWVKTLSDLHGVAFKPYLSQQFSVCYDLYLDLRTRTETRVKKVLGRDAPDFRLRTTCPACTYKLEGEADLIFDMLVTMDGNDSLKRVLRKERCDHDDNGKPLPSALKERKDPRVDTAGKDYYLSSETVDLWARNDLQSWQRRRMWGVFDETGVFLALYMVRSGELAKYPLAIVDALLDAFGPKLGVGYDIGCGFGTTVRNSPLGKKAKDLKMKTLVGAFHGHAHNRLCQLEYLANYVPGMGLEDLEGCERLFSKSNFLARSVQYASIFHRKQTIVSYMSHHDDFESYANLSAFLVNTYWQAIEIIDGEPALQVAMQAAGIQDVSEFRKRLDMEKKYLTDLKTDDEENTLQMEYYQKLVNLEERKQAIGEGSRATQVTRRHAQENYDGALAAVQQQEEFMAIEIRWLPTSDEWAAAAYLVSTKRYRTALSRLERLVIQRMFELTKMNMSQTGYKLRKHIAKALQARSQAVRSALVSYNDAAASLATPARKLSWSEVIMDAHFKIERAREEILRLNIEIRRVVTKIRDERVFLLEKEAEVRQTDPGLAFMIRLHRRERGRFDEVHMKRFRKLADQAKDHFTGTLVPGVWKQDPVQEPAPMEEASRLQALESEQAALNLAAQLDRTHINSEDVIRAGEEEAEVDDYVGEVQESEEVAENLHLILQASTD